MEQTAFSQAGVHARMAALLDAGFEPVTLAGGSALRAARGTCAGQPLLLVATDPAIDKGVIGLAECEALLDALAQPLPLALMIDSAGARLGDGLAIQGALRRVMRALLDAGLEGRRSFAMLGHHAFGGASMLAFGTTARSFVPATLLAMTGPRGLAGEVDRHVVLTTIGGAARAACVGAGSLIEDSAAAHRAQLAQWLAAPQGAVSLHEERAALAARLGGRVPQPGITRDGGRLAALGIARIGAAEALALAEALDAGPGLATLVLDGLGHAILIEDEALLLTQYLVHLARTVRARVRGGAPLRFEIAGSISGGIYIAAAGAASEVAVLPTGAVTTLPLDTLGALLTRPDAASAGAGAERSRYAALGVAETVID